MARTGTFLCTKQHGKPKIWDRQGLDAVLAQYGDGEDYNLTIEEVGKHKTNAQRRFFHGPILNGFIKKGWRKQEAKDMLCILLIPRDIRLPDGSYVRVPGHTEELSREEYTALIDGAMQIAAENDVYIEDADEWRTRMRRERKIA